MFFLAKLACISLFLITVTKGSQYDYTDIEFCGADMKCENKANTGCHCGNNDKIREIAIDLVGFRQAMVDTHNRLRQKVASGEETSSGTGQASNMNAISYDLELEHLARCWLMGKDGPMGAAYHDKCRKTKTFHVNAGQNLAFASNAANCENKDNYQTSVENWYSEVADVTADVIENFHPPGGKVVGHFTQIVWAEATHIGCARGCRDPLFSSGADNYF